MTKQELKEGMVVQLNPENTKNPAFAGCFMTVSDPKPFGAQGYIQGVGTREGMGGKYYYRASWDEMELVGQAVWIVQD